MSNIIVSKNTKYLTGNIISRYLINNFFKKIKYHIYKRDYKELLEVGCGEGLLLKNVIKNDGRIHKISAVDIDEVEIMEAKKNVPFVDFTVADIYKLPFFDNEFELVLCCEVLEHLENPEQAIDELARVCGKYCLISVPNEPLWRFLNMIRGSYISDFGNTPGHVNHWNAGTLKKLVEKKFEIREINKTIPWIILFAKKI